MVTPKKNLRTGTPIWGQNPKVRLPVKKLTRDRSTDICIIGAGISGAMAAQELSEAGFKIIMLDRRGPMKGATAATTALLQYDIDQPLSLLRQQIGTDKAIRAWRRSKLAIESLSAKITALGICCDMERLNSLYLAGDVLDADGLRHEWEWRKLAGLHTEYHTAKELRDTFGIKRAAALRSFGNLSANPLAMTAGFLRSAVAHGTEIYAPVTADIIETHRDGVLVHTKEGPSITAKTLIYATGYELPKAITTKRHKILSTYAIATKPQRGKLWPGESLIWEASDPYLYLRTTADGRVICGGEDEDFSDEKKRDALLPKKQKILERKLKQLFPQLDARADYAWTGSFGSSVTGLPSIGAVPGKSHCYAILAYGGNGITFSRIAAEMLRATLTGKHDPDQDLFEFA